MKLDLRKINPGEIEAATALLFPDVVRLPGQPLARSEFLGQMRELGYDFNHIVVAASGDQLIGCLLYVPAPDGTVLLARPRIDRPASPDSRRLEIELIRFCREVSLAEKRLFLQSLSGADDTETQSVFIEAGFHFGARLLHMRRNAETAAASLANSSNAPDTPALEFVPYSQANHGRFARVVGQTYEGTLDCANIPHVDDLEQVIATHKQAGRFDPNLWWLAADDGGDVGVILINPQPHRRCFDLVYMGVVPSRRGHGMGAVLLDEGIGRTQRRSSNAIELAVDCANRPAIRMYESRRFRTIGSSIVLIDDLMQGTPRGK